MKLTSPIPSSMPARHPLRLALRRGWHRRCPNCGAGPMMQGYLRVRERCPVCRQPLGLGRDREAALWAGILVLGGALVPVLTIRFSPVTPNPLMLLTLSAIGMITLCLYLLPRIKGACVALHWIRGR